MNAMASSNGQNDNEGGPMWGRFFDSIGHDEDGSVLSGSHNHTDVRSFPSMDIHMQSPMSEVHPNDSASVMDDDQVSALDSYAHRKGISSAPVPIPADDGTYVFKFRTPSGRTHRFQSRHDDVEHLREIVTGKLTTDPFFVDFEPTEGATTKPDPTDFHLSYTDADGDSVLITSDHDVTEAVKIARGTGSDRVVLVLQGGKGWADALALRTAAKEAAATVAAVEPHEIEKPLEPVAASPEPSAVNSPIPFKETVPEEIKKRAAHSDEVFGIPKDLLLPASIGALAVVIIGVFTISRLTANNY